MKVSVADVRVRVPVGKLFALIVYPGSDGCE